MLKNNAILKLGFDNEIMANQMLLMLLFDKLISNTSSVSKTNCTNEMNTIL